MSDASITVLGVIGAALLTFIGSIYATRKTASKTEALIVYRIDKLEEKVDKHNSVIERTYKLEGRADLLCQRIDDLEKKG